MEIMGWIYLGGLLVGYFMVGFFYKKINKNEDLIGIVLMALAIWPIALPFGILFGLFFLGKWIADKKDIL